MKKASIQLKQVNPCKLIINAAGHEEYLRELLSYNDKTVDFEIRRIKKMRWLGEEAKQERLEELNKQRIQCLLKTDKQGNLWTYSGLLSELTQRFNCNIETAYNFPESKLLPWAKKPEFELYPYQVEAVETLLEHKHAAVELPTGSGKSLIIAHLIKRLGLKTMVMAPNVSIGEQLADSFISLFGKKYVGFFGNGKKDSKKLITVGIAASFTRIEQDSPHWKELQKVQVFISDESHQNAASTLAKVCFGLMENAPYRFFMSATQMRNDGKDLLLKAITGDVVQHMSIREAVDRRYLANLKFTMVNVVSDSTVVRDDVNEMTREHLYYNKNVNRIAGELVNKFVGAGKQVLVLIKEMEQFTELLPYLRHEVGFAHGGVTDANKKKVPPEYHKSDPNELVRSFNAGKLKVLIGTNCVSTGTDIKANEATIYLQGGKSEVQVTQGAIGRSTRRHALVGKTSCQIIDFDVVNIPVIHRHAEVRKEIYDAAYGPVKSMSFGGQ